MSNTIKMLVLSLTGECNFACRYCYAANHSNETMDLNIAIAALKMAQASGERFILQFSGGEPLLNYSVLREIVLYVKENKIPAIMQIQTNASLLTDEIAKFLYENDVAIGVSLDGRPKENDKLRLGKNGLGSSCAILKGIEVLRRNNIACGITCVVSDENVKALAGIVDLAFFLGNIRKIGFDILRGQGRGNNLKPPIPADMAAAMKTVYARRDKLFHLTGIKMEISQLERAKAIAHDTGNCFKHCYAMRGEAAFVDAKGDIYACSSLVGEKDFYIGNVFAGLDETLVEKIANNISLAMRFCKECADFHTCGGGCFARWYGMEAKELYAAECEMKRISIQKIQ